MRKILLYLAGVLLAITAVLTILVYRWTQTKNGRLHPIMAIFHQLERRLGKMEATPETLAARRARMNRRELKIRLAAIEDRELAGPHGPIPIHLYTPEGDGPFPVIVFFHGGGFALGGIASHENIARRMARDTAALVVSVDYHLAPEHPFPTAVEDAYFALEWAAAETSSLNGDPQRLIVAGDSAGGNLAAAVCHKARDESGPAIHLQALFYPALTMLDDDNEARRQFAGYILTETEMRQFRDWYLPNETDREHPYASPLAAADLHNLPPAYVVTAEFDPLVEDGRQYAERLAAAGVPVVYQCYPGMMHAFLSFGDVLGMFPGQDRLLPAAAAVYAEMAQLIAQINNPIDNFGLPLTNDVYNRTNKTMI